MNLKALLDKLSALMGEADAIGAKDAPTVEDVARIKAIPAEMDTLREQIEAAQKIEATRSWASQTTGMLPLADTTKAAGTAVADPPRVDLGVKAWYGERFKSIPAGAEQIARELYADYGNGSYEQLMFDKHQSFVKFVRTGELGYTPEERRLAKMIVLTPGQIIAAAASGISVKAIKLTMVEGIDTLGGYLVPEDFRETLVERLPGMTVVRKRADVQTTSRDVLTMPRVTGGTSRYTGNVRWTLVNETPLGTEAATNATFGELRIPVYTAMGHVAISKNTLEDAVTNLIAYLSKELTSSSAIFEDELFLVGVTNGGGNGPQGILAGTSNPNAPINADVNLVVSGSAAALTGDGLKKVPFGIAKQYRSNNACWIMNKATLQAASILKDGNGQYLIGGGPEGRLNAQAVPDSMLGYAVEESEAMPDIAASVYPIIFGDLGGYTIADRVGMSIERYDDSVTAKSNSVVIVARRRVGGQVTQGWRLVAHQCHT